MSGNLREWCLNDYKDYTDQTVHYELRKKVLRGGAFNLPAFDLRSTLRFVRYPADYGYSFGFRCAYSQNSSEHPALTAQMF
jgi:formylglycine-generating enzyme required for sulfatase activity